MEAGIRSTSANGELPGWILGAQASRSRGPLGLAGRFWDAFERRRSDPIVARAPRSGFVRVVVGAIVWVAALLLFASGLLLEPSGNGNDPVTNAAISLAVVSPVTVGAILVTRLPRNLIGWLLLVSGLVIALSLGLSGLADYGLNAHPGSVPGAIWIAVLSQLTWVPFVVGLGFYLPLLYPSGHLPSPRWRPVAFLGIVAILFSTAQNALAPFTAGAFPAGDKNPLAIGGPVGQLASLLGLASSLIGVFAVPLVAASLVIRYRRASGIERQQLKWLAAVAVIVGPALAVAIITGGSNVTGVEAVIGGVAWLIVLLGFGLLPVAIGIAILRYRLYEIDLLINRTAVYGVVSLVLVAVFGTAYLLLQRLVESATGQRSDLVAIAVVGGAAVTSGPLRRRVRPLVDRVLPARALLTLLFTDIVGSTQTVAELGDQRWRGLLDRYLATVRAELSRHRGHEVNTAGDAFFATFERPADGLACAWAIRSTVGGLGLGTRTGLHRGECEMRGEQPSGLAVHTAARVMAAAGEGEILVSDALREALAASDLSLADRGRHELRGVPGEWQLYAAEPVGKTS